MACKLSLHANFTFYVYNVDYMYTYISGYSIALVIENEDLLNIPADDSYKLLPSKISGYVLFFYIVIMRRKNCWRCKCLCLHSNQATWLVANIAVRMIYSFLMVWKGWYMYQCSFLSDNKISPHLKYLRIHFIIWDNRNCWSCEINWFKMWVVVMLLSYYDVGFLWHEVIGRFPGRVS